MPYSCTDLPIVRCWIYPFGFSTWTGIVSLGVLIQDKEMHERYESYDKAIVCKGSQRRFIKEPQEPKYRNIGGNKSDDKADSNHDQVITRQER